MSNNKNFNLGCLIAAIVYILYCIFYWASVYEGRIKDYENWIKNNEVTVVVILLFTFGIIILIGLYSDKKSQKQKITQDRNKEFKKEFPDVAERYYNAIEKLNNIGKNEEDYRKYIENIYANNLSLFFKVKEVKEKINQYIELKTTLEKTISTSGNKEKNTISIDQLNKVNIKIEKSNNYIQEAREAISSTAQDFLNVQSEIMLKDSTNDIKTMNELLSALETKSKTLAYIQSNMPDFDSF